MTHNHLKDKTPVSSAARHFCKEKNHFGETTMYKLLDQINSPRDLKKLDVPQLAQLAKEMREFLISTISKTGGHLAPSLGVVELTLVLHYLYDTPNDKLIWDVGHQAYIHKIITGRRERFGTIRQYNGISGFPKIEESEYDHFGVGHASTSISAALGIAAARDLKHETNKVVAIIGDGSLTAGLAFEGLNNIGSLNKDITVILNDNEMSISKNVGALSKYLTSLITNPVYNRIKKDVWDLTWHFSNLGRRIRHTVRRVDEGMKAILVPGLLFERLGFRYIGPVDGHNLAEMLHVFREVNKMSGPILVHLVTVKGKGYKFAEENSSKFHGPNPFDRLTGQSSAKSDSPSFSQVFGDTLAALAEKNNKIVAITAAMSIGTGLSNFAEKFPDRFFDVGIAEPHAVTFAAGLATQGFRPVAAIYSSFLQRAYDQIIHDVALQKLPVIFALDRAGIVGDDGPTHHGVFDLSFLRYVPNMVVMAPKDEQEMQNMLFTATEYTDGPIAMRYPRGSGQGLPLKKNFIKLPIGEAEVVFETPGSDLAILALGNMVYPALFAAQKLAQFNVGVTVVNMRFAKPLDSYLLRQIGLKFDNILTVEDNAIEGGFGSAVLEFFAENKLNHFKIKVMGIPDHFIEHGAPHILYHQLKLDEPGIFETAASLLELAAKWPETNSQPTELQFPVSGKPLVNLGRI
jgi:1-deoxy-D-xylulose-5-phosphate synthase